MNKYEIGEPIIFREKWVKITHENFENVLFRFEKNGRQEDVIPQDGYIYIKQDGKWYHRWIWPDLTPDRLEPFISRGECYTDTVVNNCLSPAPKKIEVPKKTSPRSIDLGLDF